MHSQGWEQAREKVPIVVAVVGQHLHDAAVGHCNP